MVEGGYYEEGTAKHQADLAELGVSVSPELARLVVDVGIVGGGSVPHHEARAKLDLVIAQRLLDGIGRTERAAMALVASSDDNTTKMKALGERLNSLTKAVAIAAGFSAAAAGLSTYAAFREPKPPVVNVHPAITVPAPVVQVIASTPMPAPAPSPRPAAPKKEKAAAPKSRP